MGLVSMGSSLCDSSQLLLDEFERLEFACEDEELIFSIIIIN